MKGTGRAILICGAVIVSLLGVASQPVVAVPDSSDERPTRWAPTYIVTVMANAPTNVSYWFQWSGPGSTDSEFWDTDDGVFEFGWKNTGNNGCDNDDGWVGEAGWPSGMDIQVDWTEDSSDAVIWMDSIDQLKTDIESTPADKEYAVWWNCSNSNNFDAASNPSFQVAQNQCAWPCEPWTTFTVNAMNYVPSEQGGKGVPNGGGDNRAIQTNMTAPWLNNGNFESGTGSWSTFGSMATAYSGNAHQGSSYLYLQPGSSGGGNSINSWLYQNFRVKTGSTKDPQFELGHNTGMQYEGAFRCPTWADDWAGVPGQPCKVTIWLKTLSSSTWYSRTVTIPADWKWYYVLDANSPSMTSDDDLQIWINTHGFPIDIDAQWVTSDI